MPPTRKTHHKSRNGCNQCKKRHVKVNARSSICLVRIPADFVEQCDEVQPSCGNCVKRDAPCSLSTNEQSPSTGREDRESPTDIAEPHQKILSRTEEMDLLHFYMTTTLKTLCHDPKDWQMYEHGIPQLAFQNEYLLDVLLALACLHRAKIHTLNQKFWVRCAIEYHNRALPIFFKVLSDVNDETCHAAFAL
jgi:hypothetical protein